MARETRQVLIVKFYFRNGVAITTALLEFEPPKITDVGVNEIKLWSVGLDAIKKLKREWGVELLLGFSPKDLLTYTVLEAFDMELEMEPDS